MVKHILIAMSAIAVLSNASLHVALLADWGAITLGRSWPAHLLSMVMFMLMLATLFIRWNAHAQKLIQMEHEKKQKYMQECQERGLRDTVWKRLFGATPIWVGVVVVVLFAYTFGTFAYEGFSQQGKPVAPEREQSSEFHFATAAFTLFAFIPWAYFTYSKKSRP